MCVAIPMKILDVKGSPGSFEEPPVAEVSSQGITRQVRLDIVDRWPAPGDYVIVHAGFAIHTLNAAEAEQSLELLARMQQALE